MRTLRPPFSLALLLPASAHAQATAPAAPPAPIEAPAAPASPADPSGAGTGQIEASASLSPGATTADASAVGTTAGGDVAIDPVQQSRVPIDAAHRTGFSTGLRVGVGLPLGKAGESLTGAARDLKELTPWRAPVWVDIGYTLSGALTIGGYAQVGVGGAPDSV